MYSKHEPSDEFVERLEHQIGREVRRRQRSAPISLWSAELRKKAALAASTLVVLSLGIGAAATAAAYQAKNNATRDLLVSSLERQTDLARQGLEVAQRRLEDSRRRLSIGAADPEKVAEGEVEVAEATAQFKSLELQLDEARTTGREPASQISAPVVSGRDFVKEHLRLGMSVPEAALEFERVRLENTKKRVALGAGYIRDIGVVQTRVVEEEAAVDNFKKKLEIRQQFLDHRVKAGEAELRVLESNAEQRKKILEAQLDLARKQSEDATSQGRIGFAGPVEEAEAKLKIHQLESDIAKADLDLALVRQRLNPRAKGK